MNKILICSITLLFCNICYGGYFAELNVNNVVKRVIVADSKEWCEKNLGGTWVETFVGKGSDPINSKNYCGIGYTYLPVKNNFHSPKRFTSWIFNDIDLWISPKPIPIDGKKYDWNETVQNWELRE